MSVDATVPSPEDRQRYENARKELIQALQRKRTLDRQLTSLEVQLYNFEGSYLTETTAHSGGNIIQGFDAYLKTQNVGRRRHEVTEADRMFSNSSLTYQKAIELAEVGDDSDPDRPSHFMPGMPFHSHSITIPAASSSRNGTPGLQTVVLTPAPRSSESSAAATKKQRDKEYQRKKRALQKERDKEKVSERDSVGVEDRENVAVSVGSGSSGRKGHKRARTEDD